MNKRVLWGLALIFTVSALLAWKIHRDWTNSQLHLQRARAAFALGNLNEARQHGESAVTWIASRDHAAEAWYISGRAYLEDRQLSRSERLPKAMELLARIPHDSIWYPKTALSIANDKLFEAKSPRDARQIVDEALLIWPYDTELNQWKLIWLTVTKQTTVLESCFKAAANGQAAVAEELLRIWLKSQFLPHDLETAFDRQLGVAGNQESTTDAIRLERWTTLRRWNLEEPAYVAAISEWYLQRGFLNEALERLREGKATAESSPDPYYLSVSVHAFCESGQVTLAASLLPSLQQLTSGYLYSIAAARVALAQNQRDVAVRELEAARQNWPGRIDPWLSKTLEKLYHENGDEDSVLVAKQLSAERDWLNEQQERLRDVLAKEWDSSDRTWLADFLGRLNRDLEVDILKSLP